MKLQNPFSTDTRELFRDVAWECWECGGNGQGCGGLELHHCTGRDSSSPLNGAILCKHCHNKVGHADQEQSKYLKKTIRYLLNKQNYQLTTNDLEFYQQNKRLYELENKF